MLTWHIFSPAILMYNDYFFLFFKMKYNDLSVPNYGLFAINHKNNCLVKLRSYEIQDNENTQRLLKD